jgi:hypothetical protein
VAAATGSSRARVGGEGDGRAGRARAGGKGDAFAFAAGGAAGGRADVDGERVLPVDLKLGLDSELLRELELSPGIHLIRDGARRVGGARAVCVSLVEEARDDPWSITYDFGVVMSASPRKSVNCRDDDGPGGSELTCRCSSFSLERYVQWSEHGCGWCTTMIECLGILSLNLEIVSLLRMMRCRWCRASTHA